LASAEPPRGSVATAGARFARRFVIGVLLLLVVGILGLSGWTWLTLNYAYSDGERAGILQKFSRKGWVCKTYEGELALYVVGGVAPQIWEFSVRDPKLAAELEQAVGERVQLHYSEHRGVPSACFAETNYFVESFRVVKGSPSGSP